MKNKLFFSLIVFTMSLSAYAAIPVAQVIKIRGTATKLVPGALEASKVEMGDKLFEDTSLLTGSKSFIKIKFSDNSEVSLGPESKIIISQMPTTDPGIISLLKGRIRAEIKKEAGKESGKDNGEGANKFFVRTRTAALGIRGTDFQTIYNPDNKMTSLLTYKGSVAMARVDELTHERLEGDEAANKKINRGNTSIERDNTTKALDVKTVPVKSSSQQDLLKKVLDKKETVLVPPGQNAFSSEALKKASIPVKISPVQLSALYKNRDFQEKALVNIKSGNAQQDLKSEVVQAAQIAPAEGFYNAKTGDFAPKAGGFIDLNTGLYIAPGADAVLDKEKGLYKSTKVGDIDSDTGDYFAPKGLILDAKKGFILESNTDTRPELLALREDMNISIARDVVVGSAEERTKITKNINEKFIRDRITFSVSGGDETIRINEGHTSLPNHSLEAKDLTKLSLLWNMSSTNRFSPFFGVNYRTVEFSNLSGRNFKQDSDALFSLNGGVAYALSKTVNLQAQFALNQNHFAAQNSATTFFLKRVVTSRLALGAVGEFFEKGRFSLLTEAHLSRGFRKRFTDLVVFPGSGIQLKVAPQYALSDRSKLGLGLFINHDKVRINNQFGNNHQKREEAGLQLHYALDL